jgi:hypothetical protein
MSSKNQESPYLTLSTLCYKLRSENEDLLETVTLKSELVASCEKEISLLRARISELEEKMTIESEKSIAERMEIGDHRLSLMQQSSRIESQLRDSETRCRSLQEQLSAATEQVEILLTQLEESKHTTPTVAPSSVPDIDSEQIISELRAENARMAKELENAQFIQAELESRSKRQRVDEDLNASFVSNAAADLLPSFTISAEDSLLRLFESLVGFSIVRAEDVVTLVSNSSADTKVRLRVQKEGAVSLIGADNVDESALAVLKSFNSVSGMLSKITLAELTRALALASPSDSSS